MIRVRCSQRPGKDIRIVFFRSKDGNRLVVLTHDLIGKETGKARIGVGLDDKTMFALKGVLLFKGKTFDDVFSFLIGISDKRPEFFNVFVFIGKQETADVICRQGIFADTSRGIQSRYQSEREILIAIRALSEKIDEILKFLFVDER